MDHSSGSADQSVQDAGHNSIGRKRAKRACTTCRNLKRKCDGHQPCSMCVQYEYECRFETKRPRAMSDHRNGTSEGDRRHVPSPKAMSRSGEAQQQNESARANAGINFPQTLSSRIDPQGPKMGSYAWNVGLRQTSNLCFPNRIPNSLPDLISLNDARRFAGLYFASFHTVYSFLDPGDIQNGLQERLQSPVSRPPTAFDAVLCSVLALGMLFSGEDHEVEEHSLVSYAYWILGTTSMLQSPTIHDVEAWLLRTFYLRCAGSPHAGWIASSTTMQLVEATGLHLEPAANDRQAESNRKLYWMGTVLNTWISFELGLRHTEPRGCTCLPPSPSLSGPEHDHYTDLISLYEISRQLDPDAPEPAQLEEVLSQITAIKPNHDTVILARTNLVLTVFRRLFFLGPMIPRELTKRILAALEAGLEAAKRLGESRQPWWHVSNVPFQFICVILAIDTSESLAHLGHCMKTMHSLAKQFNTPVMLKAADKAAHLIRLSQKRKQEENTYLLQGIREDAPSSGVPTARPGWPVEATVPENPPPLTGVDFNGLELDSNFDWNTLLELGNPDFL